MKAGLFRLARRAGARLWRARYLLPLSPLGTVLILLGLWLAFRYSRAQTDYVLRACGLLLLAVVSFSAVAVIATTTLLWLRLRRGGGERDLDLESGMTGTTGLRCPSGAWWPLVQLRLLWEQPVPAEVTLKRRVSGGEEVVRPLERGEGEQIVRRLLVTDIFGFSRLGLGWSAAVRVRVRPAGARVTAHLARRFLAGDALSWPAGPLEGELLEMRRYAHGDPLRHVLWKAFARTRRLLVRTAERAITPLPSVVSYLVSGPGDEPCASAARFFLEQGVLGRDFSFCAEGASEPTADPAMAMQQIIRSVYHRGDAAAGLPRFLTQIDAERRKSCVLFVPPAVGPWLETVERVAPLIPHGLAVTAIDEQPEVQETRSWRRLLFAEDPSSRRALRSLAEVARRLAAAGLEVQVLHRPTGELLGRAQLEALQRSAA